VAKITIKQLLDLKGKRKLTLTTAFDYWTARACELAGVDVLVTWPQHNETMEELRIVLDQVRKGAPNVLIGAGIPRYEAYVSETDAIRCAWAAIKAGADLIYSSGMEPAKFKALGRERIPFVGHVGYIPAHNTWFGGPRAVGKTSAEATQVYEDTLAFQEMGAVAVEMECVPARVAEEITRRVDLLVFSMGSGGGCDGQFLFSCDIWGAHDGHYPRHAKKYRDFFSESIAAMREYREDVTTGAFPAHAHEIALPDAEFERWQAVLASDAGNRG
jgi:3-methyl-2-oxobutanoate hydroxymethyltransferase